MANTTSQLSILDVDLGLKSQHALNETTNDTNVSSRCFVVFPQFPPRLQQFCVSPVKVQLLVLLIILLLSSVVIA